MSQSKNTQSENNPQNYSINCQTKGSGLLKDRKEVTKDIMEELISDIQDQKKDKKLIQKDSIASLTDRMKGSNLPALPPKTNDPPSKSTFNSLPKPAYDKNISLFNMPGSINIFDQKPSLPQNVITDFQNLLNLKNIKPVKLMQNVCTQPVKNYEPLILKRPAVSEEKKESPKSLQKMPVSKEKNIRSKSCTPSEMKYLLKKEKYRKRRQKQKQQRRQLCQISDSDTEEECGDILKDIDK